MENLSFHLPLLLVFSHKYMEYLNKLTESKNVNTQSQNQNKQV